MVVSGDLRVGGTHLIYLHLVSGREFRPCCGPCENDSAIAKLSALGEDYPCFPKMHRPSTASEWWIISRDMRKWGEICRLMLCHLALDSCCELAFGRMIISQEKECETRLCVSIIDKY